MVNPFLLINYVTMKCVYIMKMLIFLLLAGHCTAVSMLSYFPPSLIHLIFNCDFPDLVRSHDDCKDGVAIMAKVVADCSSYLTKQMTPYEWEELSSICRNL